MYKNTLKEFSIIIFSIIILVIFKIMMWELYKKKNNIK